MKLFFFLFLILAPVTGLHAQQAECPVKEQPGYEREVSHYLTQLIKSCEVAMQVGITCARGSLSDIIIGDAVQTVCSTEMQTLRILKNEAQSLKACQNDCTTKIPDDTAFADALRSFCVAEQQRRFISMKRRAILMSAQNLCANVPTKIEQ